MGFTWRAWGRAALVIGVVSSAAHGGSALAKGASSEDEGSKVDSEKTDAELMYEALKKSGRNDHDAAIDRAIARAQPDSDKERKALRTQAMSARVWKDPIVAAAARAGRASARARAEAALARAEAARARRRRQGRGGRRPRRRGGGAPGVQ